MKRQQEDAHELGDVGGERARHEGREGVGDAGDFGFARERERGRCFEAEEGCGGSECAVAVAATAAAAGAAVVGPEDELQSRLNLRCKNGFHEKFRLEFWDEGSGQRAGRQTHLDNASGVHDVCVVGVQVAAKSVSRACALRRRCVTAAAAYDIAAGVGVAGGSSKAGGSDGGMAVAAAAAALPLGPRTGYLRTQSQLGAQAGCSCDSLVLPSDAKRPAFLQRKVRGDGNGFLRCVAEELVRRLHFHRQYRPITKIL